MQLIVVGCLLFVVVLADTNLDSQIFRGHEAKDGQFPYQVGLRMQGPHHFYQCGGSLISPTWIATAAHCVDYPVENITTFLGSLRLSEGTKRPALNKIVYPRLEIFGSDIALIEIEAISYSDTIKSISLPALSEPHLHYQGHIAVTSGWGLMNESSTADILQYTHLIVISNKACARAHPLPIHDFNDRIICAADPDGSTGCPGDSGGPLVDMDSELLIGIVSGGPTDMCSTVHFGNRYMRVTSFRQWIYNSTGI